MKSKLILTAALIGFLGIYSFLLLMFWQGEKARREKASQHICISMKKIR